MPPVARCNDRARATSDGGTREGGASRPDYATVTTTPPATKTPLPPTVPSSATLSRCFAGALRLRRATGISPTSISCNRMCICRPMWAPRLRLQTGKRHRHPPCPHRQRFRVASRVRSAYAALRFPPQAMPPVARRNDRARETSDGGTREGGASRPDYASKRENATAAHRALIGNAFALLRGCAPLTPRYGVILPLYTLASMGLPFDQSIRRSPRIIMGRVRSMPMVNQPKAR